ncbi:site-specific integrase [Streptomyces hygroscopicus]|uniref:site-specific integrase n=1 Tax=Streptomyces hygroscopicus TaxID=1912 RepID=UPI0036B578EB
MISGWKRRRKIWKSIPRKARKAERKTKAEIIPWNVSEVHTFVQGMSGDRLYAPLLLSLMGLRPAEVVALRWSDIDLTNDTLTVANTRTMMGNKTVVEKDTKSMAGERILPLPIPVKDALKKFKALQAAEKMTLGTGYVDSGYIASMPSEKSTPPGNSAPVRTSSWRSPRYVVCSSTTPVRRASPTWPIMACRITSGTMGGAHQRQDHQALVCEAGR